ncbi:MAG TPA: SDR family oxidoreductase [Isosphaeraceae bacterium]|nr:SDR family oxidoreductase [Isosphaeraceae bacterium]
MSLEGKIAVVTGASRGIGRAIALRLARDGALVCVNYHSNTEAAQSLVREIQSAGGDAFALQADVSSVAQLGRFFEALDTELTARRGDRGFDILVNNAGVAVAGRTAKSTEADFDRVFTTNVKGPFFVTQHAIPRLRDGGRVINVSSNLSRRPMPQYTAYSMTKGAIDTFTLALAAELGRRGITVNALAPGLTATDMNAELRANPNAERAFSSTTALGRIGSVEDLASAASLLASPDAGWITGQYVEASGGLGLVTPGFDRTEIRD